MPSMHIVIRLFALLAVLATALGADSNSAAPVSAERFSEFHFVRLIYNAVPGSRRDRWFTDAPAADEHLIGGVRR